MRYLINIIVPRADLIGQVIESLPLKSSVSVEAIPDSPVPGFTLNGALASEDVSLMEQALASKPKAKPGPKKGHRRVPKFPPARGSRVHETILRELNQGPKFPLALNTALIDVGLSKNSLGAALVALSRSGAIERRDDGMYQLKTSAPVEDAAE